MKMKDLWVDLNKYKQWKGCTALVKKDTLEYFYIEYYKRICYYELNVMFALSSSAGSDESIQ